MAKNNWLSKLTLLAGVALPLTGAAAQTAPLTPTRPAIQENLPPLNTIAPDPTAETAMDSALTNLYKSQNIRRADPKTYAYLYAMIDELHSHIGARIPGITKIPPKAAIYIYDSTELNASAFILQNVDKTEPHYSDVGNATAICFTSALLEQPDKQIVYNVSGHETGHTITAYNYYLLLGFDPRDDAALKDAINQDLVRQRIIDPEASLEIGIMPYKGEMQADLFGLRLTGSSPKDFYKILTVVETKESEIITALIGQVIDSREQKLGRLLTEEEKADITAVTKEKIAGLQIFNSMIADDPHPDIPLREQAIQREFDKIQTKTLHPVPWLNDDRLKRILSYYNFTPLSLDELLPEGARQVKELGERTKLSSIPPVFVAPPLEPGATYPALRNFNGEPYIVVDEKAHRWNISDAEKNTMVTADSLQTSPVFSPVQFSPKLLTQMQTLAQKMDLGCTPSIFVTKLIDPSHDASTIFPVPTYDNAPIIIVSPGFLKLAEAEQWALIAAQYSKFTLGGMESWEGIIRQHDDPTYAQRTTEEADRVSVTNTGNTRDLIKALSDERNAQLHHTRLQQPDNPIDMQARINALKKPTPILSTQADMDADARPLLSPQLTQDIHTLSQQMNLPSTPDFLIARNPDTSPDLCCITSETTQAGKQAVYIYLGFLGLPQDEQKALIAAELAKFQPGGLNSNGVTAKQRSDRNYVRRATLKADKVAVNITGDRDALTRGLSSIMDSFLQEANFIVAVGNMTDPAIRIQALENPHSTAVGSAGSGVQR